MNEGNNVGQMTVTDGNADSSISAQLKFNISTMMRITANKLLRNSCRTSNFLAHHAYFRYANGFLQVGSYPFLATQPRYAFSSQPQTNSKDELSHFKELLTNPNILNRLEQNSMSVMFPIQSATFQLILDGRDILARDRTGSGKTLAYALPILQKFYKSGLHPRNIKLPKFLVICPTRELVLQVASEIYKFASQYRVVTVYGGASISHQINQLEKGAAIVVATPGRLIDLIDKQAISLKGLEVVCVDEADTMLQKGFKLDIQSIFDSVKRSAGQTQNLMFSATIPPWVSKITERYLKNMVQINMIKDEDVRTSETVQHYALLVRESERYAAVLRLIQRYNPDNRTIIFTQTKAEANEFIKYFQSDTIVILHGDIPQNIRETNMARFKKGDRKILIATDVAARGLDIPNVQLVIQLSPPENPEPYIHRSGRTGRAGREGTNITFFDQSNIEDLLQIQRQAKIQIKIINNNFDISAWKNRARALAAEIEASEQSKDDPFYMFFIQQILKKTKPQFALLHFLKKRLGKIPQTTSSITNKKGYITYIAYKKDPNSAPLKDTFPGIDILHLTEDQSQLKFDIVYNDFYKFEELVDAQQGYELQIVDENNISNLRQFHKHLKQISHVARREDRNRRDGGQRDGDSFRQRRDNNFKEVSPDCKNIFISRIDMEINQKDLQQQLNELGARNYSLKIVTKQGDDGQYKFGFIDFENSRDCVQLLNNRTIRVKGHKINLKPSLKNY